MKKIILFSVGIFLMLVGITSCYNQEWSFPDYEYTSSYFPYQYPIRTLVLGDYYFDNTNDNNHKFLITATMGGVYMNKQDIVVNFEVDESLTDSLYIGTTKIMPLPKSYYTLSNESQINIVNGELFGGVEVQLTDEFFDDPNSVGFLGTKYVVPLRITSATTDSVLVGSPSVDNPDPRVASDWTTKPMDFVLYGINYVNEYHGNFLLRGQSQVMSGNDVVETNIYHSQYVEQDEIVSVNTVSRNAVTYKHRIERVSSSSPGEFEMHITFDSSGNAVITKTNSSAFSVSGTAKFVKDSEEWGGKSRHAIYLDYSVDDGTYVNNAKDTLVFRDKGVTFQEFVPELR